MKAKINENRPLAWVVLAIVVVLSIIFSGGGALRGVRAQALDVFHYGVNGDSLCIYSDLMARVDCAYNLADTAARYDSIAQESIDKVNEAAEELDKTNDSDIAALNAADDALDRAVESLYTGIENARLSDADATFALSQYKEFTSRALTISRDGYNGYAEAFNEMLGAFPASVVGMMSGVRQLPLFR